MYDDCLTDDEQLRDAKAMVNEDLKKAVNEFKREKRDGTVELYVKNLNTYKRFNRSVF